MIKDRELQSELQINTTVRIIVLFLGRKTMRRKCRDNKYKFMACVRASGMLSSRVN